MPIFAIPAIVGGVIAGGSSIAGGLIGASAANNAAKTQANAAIQAAQLQNQATNRGLDIQEQQFAQQQKNIQPWLQTGGAALGSLGSLMGLNPSSSYNDATGQFQPQANGVGSLMQPWTQQFSPPTAAQAAATPGYQFQLEQGNKAIQNSAAARGGLLSGGTAKAMDRYSQGLASTNYQQTYNNAFNEYATRYNQFQQNQANQYNRLASLAGVGQTAAGQMNQASQNYAGNAGNLLMSGAAMQGQQLNNAAAARGSGYVGSANAWSNALGGGANSIMQGLLLNSLFGQNGGGGAQLAPATAGYQWNPNMDIPGLG